MTVLQDLHVSPVGIDKLRLFQSLVEKWTPRINLIARSTVSDLWDRHILDSAELCRWAPERALRWADLGAGGGFPGLVASIILQDRGRSTEVVLVESDLRKATFLREAARQLGVSAQIRSDRIENLEPLAADVISARALASLDDLCGLSARHLTANGMCLFPKGERFAAEVAIARNTWRFDLEARENTRHKGSALLELRNLRRA